VDNPLENDLTTILWSRRQNVGNEVNAYGLVEVVVVEVATIVEVVV
jgi:hypothetical protein